MTKAELIEATGYSEDELMHIALVSMHLRAKEWRNNSTDSDSWDHYDRLVRAYDCLVREHGLALEGRK